MSRSIDLSRRSPAAAGVAAPADKRFRRSGFRPDRRRLGRTLIRLAAWLAPGVAGLAAAFWGFSVLVHAELLSVQNVSVHGNVRLSVGEVLALMDGVKGENIFQVDFERYKRRVMDSPWVADVTLARILPATIDVRVFERTPLAIARLADQLYLVDDTGVIIDEYGAQYRDFDLPIVDGLVSTPSTAGPLVDRARVRLTDAFLRALRAQPGLGRRLSQLDVANPHDAVVMFDNDPVWLHLGEDRFIERLKTYIELMPMLKERFGQVDYIDLRFDDRVFVHSRGRTDQTYRGVP